MRQLSIQKVFVYVAAMFGVLFLVLTPPFQSPDEGSHFKKAYVMAKGDFFPEIVNGKEGFYISDAIVEYISNQEEIIGNTDEKYSYTDILNEEKGARVYEDNTFTQFSTMTTNPIGHIIPMMGILVGKIVSTIAGREPSIVMLLYFARLFCLVFYIACVTLAIKITPVLKKTFCMIGLMPMALYISCSVSYDGLLISVAFIFASLCFKLLFEQQTILNKYYVITFGVIAFVFYAIKIVYLPLFLLLLFIPKEKFKEGKRIKSLAYVFIVFTVLVVLSMLPDMLRDNVVAATDSGSKDQIIYILQNPLRYLEIWFETMKEGRDFFVSSTIGVFGLVDTHLYAVIIYPYVFFLMLTGALEISINNVVIKWYQRVSVIVSVFTCIFGTFLAMYVLWTPFMEGFGVGADRINGVQGRYFIPLFPIFFVCFTNGFIIKNKMVTGLGEKLVNNSMLISVIMLMVSQITLLLRFWV